MEPRALYLSLAPVEEIPLYHSCPSCLAARLLLPGGWPCRVCRWSSVAGEKAVAARVLEPRVLRLLRVSRPEVLLVDGVEPIAAGSWVLRLPEVVEREAGYQPLMAIASSGAAEASVLEEAAAGGYRVLLFDYVAHAEKPPGGLSGAVEALAKGYEVFTVVEIVFHWLRGRRGQSQVLAGLADRYPEAGIHVAASHDAVEEAAKVVEKLRDRGLNVYLHPDDAFLYSDTRCPRCGETLVARRPWGVRLYAEPRGAGEPARCPRCGAVVRLFACKPRRPMAIHREQVVW